MAGRKTINYREPAIVKKPMVTTNAEFTIIPPPEKHVLASMKVEISTKELKRRLPKPVLPEVES